MVDESGGHDRGYRIFRIDSDAGADELYAKPFDDERQMQDLIERRIDKLFPGLELLGSEYRNLDDGKHRLDTIAFHKEKNTFVVIEYKNTRNTGVIAQAKSYLKYVREKRAELTLSYGKKTGLYPDPNQFEWNAAYAIIVAPEFSANHIDSTVNDTDVELYRIERYGEDIVVLQRAGGAHKNVSASGSSNQNGLPDPRTDPVAAEKNYLDKKGTFDATRTVWYELKKRVKDELGIEFNISKVGGAFYLQNRRLVCWIMVKSDRVELLSCDIKKDQEIQTDDFITPYKTHKDGTKNYRAYVDTVDDIENAVRVIHTLYNLKSNGDRSVSVNLVPKFLPFT